MSEALVPAVARSPAARTGTAAMTLPAVIVDAGPVAVERFLEFFAAQVANACTRAAYGRAVGRFLSWCAARGLGLRAIAPLHVAAYIRTHPGSAPTVKQHLAAIRVLWSWPDSVDTYPLGEEEESTMPKSRPPYPAAFRQQMVELVRSGRTPGELAREFEPSAEAIRNWVAQADRDAGKRTDGLRTEEQEEIRRLRRENRQLREEREILAKATAWFARETGPGRTTGS